MNTTLSQRTLVLEFGTGFGTSDLGRVLEVIDAFAPVERVTLDFTGVRRIDDAIRSGMLEQVREGSWVTRRPYRARLRPGVKRRPI